MAAVVRRALHGLEGVGLGGGAIQQRTRAVLVEREDLGAAMAEGQLETQWKFALLHTTTAGSALPRK